jgi:hypothetical protein
LVALPDWRTDQAGKLPADGLASEPQHGLTGITMGEDIQGPVPGNLAINNRELLVHSPAQVYNNAHSQESTDCIGDLVLGSAAEFAGRSGHDADVNAPLKSGVEMVRPAGHATA